MASNTRPVLVYVGTYTRTESHVQGRGEGIYVYEMDPSSGALSLVQTVSGQINPTFLTLHPSRRYLYAVCEVDDLEGQRGGGVSAFAIDSSTGRLSYLNTQSSVGPGPCHLSVEATGRYVLVANYVGGSVAMLPLQGDGRLGAVTSFVQHTGSSIDPDRQTQPHGHAITPDPANRYALAADLGIDRIMIYRLDLERGVLVPNEEPSAGLPPGSGPRHLTFHPNGRFVYAINELGSTVTAFAYDAERGALREIETISTLPDGYGGTNYCADVHFHPSGKFLYGSNRGHDSIVIYAVDAQTGRLTPVGHEATRGRFPRNFAVDAGGSLLLAANQDTDTIVPFRIDWATGKLTPTGHVNEVPTPVCVEIVYPS